MENNEIKKKYVFIVAGECKRYEFDVEEDSLSKAIEYFHDNYPLSYGFLGTEVNQGILEIRVLEKDHANHICDLLDFERVF